ncbi:uncharacterized protein C8R40DRAFT_465299 [Lentinula edodes]|uniref:uncharacterized protein n=1 Tax=Lentinula edodes TaxID=5353 RepID=UPI001E8DA27A|nr:uncharacterized protein C8R40DRAFT_465299 [Lentinula edodes]KAH7880089.1 hypothetical protein C8R40DRAFT_465299 [Lentinula edodes]
MRFFNHTAFLFLGLLATVHGAPLETAHKEPNDAVESYSESKVHPSMRDPFHGILSGSIPSAGINDGSPKDTKRFGKLDTENNPWNTRYEAIVIALNAGGSLRAPPGLKLKARPSPAVPTKIRTRVEQYFQHQFPRLRTVVNFAEDSYYESKDFEQSFSILYKWKGEDRTWMANI